MQINWIGSWVLCRAKILHAYEGGMVDAVGAEVWGLWFFNGTPYPPVHAFVGGPTDTLGKAWDRFLYIGSGSYQCCVTDVLREGCPYNPPCNQASPCVEVPLE